MNLKLKKKHLFILLYLLLFLLFIITKKSVVLYGTCIVTTAGLFFGILSIEIAFIFSLMIGSELICIINIFICIFYLFIKKRLSKIRYEKNVLICVAFLLLIALVNMVISGGVFNTLFGIFYYCLVLLVAISVKGNLAESKLVYALKLGLISQFVCGVVIIVLEKNFSSGDIHCGTFSDANYAAIFLIVSLYYVLKYSFSNGLTIKQVFKVNYVYIFGATVFIILSSAKNVIVGLVFAVIVYAISKKVTKNKSWQIINSILVMYIAIFGGILIMHSQIINSFLMRVAPQELGIYFYNKEYSFKYDYFEGTIFEELAGPRMLFGYGIGQYGSRVANMFGYNSMYREDNSINRFIADHFEEQILPNYKKYASRYSKEISEDIRWRSAILTYPYSSIIAFLAENGVIGLLFMTYIWGRAGNKSKYGFLVSFLFSICIFDIYFDHICVTALIIALLMSDKKMEKNRGVL